MTVQERIIILKQAVVIFSILTVYGIGFYSGAWYVSTVGSIAIALDTGWFVILISIFLLFAAILFRTYLIRSAGRREG